MSHRTLIVGADSLIGGALLRRLQALGRLTIGTSRRDRGALFLDLGAPTSFSAAISPAAAHAVICAGIAGDEAISRDESRAQAINVAGTTELIRRLTDAGTFCWFLSTSMVFDGSVPAPRAETLPSPQTPYGRMKHEVEQFILEHCARRAAIVRLTKVLGADWPLGRRAVAAAQTRATCDAFRDWIFAPVLLTDVVDAFVRLLDERPVRQPAVFHLSAADSISYVDGSRQLYALSGASAELVRACSIHDSRAVTWNPRHATLDCTWEAAHLGWPQRSSAENLERGFSRERVAA
jgi:dTDP-4-dehydrorhamnose reductase